MSKEVATHTSELTKCTLEVTKRISKEQFKVDKKYTAEDLILAAARRGGLLAGVADILEDKDGAVIAKGLLEVLGCQCHYLNWLLPHSHLCLLDEAGLLCPDRDEQRAEFEAELSKVNAENSA
jgi:hypothetical protein